MNTFAKTTLDPANLLRYGIGFDHRFFERSADAPNFPPHNINQLGEDEFCLTLAVAGFTENDIEITLNGDILTVTGQRPNRPLPDGERLLYSGIAFRDFTRQFKVGDHVYADAATLKDGLLQIDLVRRLPETLKPKRIAINLPPLEYAN